MTESDREMQFISLVLQMHETGLSLQHDAHQIISRIENVRDKGGNIPASIVDIELKIRMMVFTITEQNKALKNFITGLNQEKEKPGHEQGC